MKSKKYKKHILAIECGHLSSESVSGGDLILKNMLPYLIKDYKITVIVPKIASNHWKNFKTVQLKILPISPLDRNANPFIVMLTYIIRSIKSYKLLDKINFDILYSSTNILSDVLPAYLYKITHRKTNWIARIHHLIPKPSEREGNQLINFLSYIVQLITLSMLKSADTIIVLNTNLKTSLEKSWPSGKKISVIPAGVDLAKINRVNIENQIYDAMFVGRMHQTKGILDLPEIWGRVCKYKPNAKLIIIGEKNAQIMKKLIRSILKLNLQKNIQIVGTVSQDLLYESLKASKVFLFTDKEAGFSMSTSEAMASGTPVVGYDIGILGNVFKKGYIKVPLSNKDKFAKAIVKIITNTKLRNKLSEEAKSNISTFTWQTASIKFKKVIDAQSD